MQPLILFSGPTGIGKSTWLQEHLPPSSLGILSFVKEGSRYFLDLASQLPWPMEAAAGEAEVLLVGRYRFSTSAFKRAKKLLMQASQEPPGSWLVVDEVGPLELRGEGLGLVLPEMLKYAGPQLWVVREACLQAVLQQWTMSGREVLVVQWAERETLQQLFQKII